MAAWERTRRKMLAGSWSALMCCRKCIWNDSGNLRIQCISICLIVMLFWAFLVIHESWASKHCGASAYTGELCCVVACFMGTVGVWAEVNIEVCLVSFLVRLAAQWAVRSPVNVSVKEDTPINSLELCRVLVSHLVTLTEEFAVLGS